MVTSPGGRFHFECLRGQGHADDLLILVERRAGLAFTSDAVMPRYRMLFSDGDKVQEDVGLIYDTIEALVRFTEGMKELTVFAAGHDPFRPGRAFLQERATELWDLHAEVHRLHVRGLSDKEIARQLLGEDPAISRLTLGDLSRANLVKALLAWPRG